MQSHQSKKRSMLRRPSRSPNRGEPVCWPAMPARRRPRELPHIGWREWVELPELGIRRIKAKIDTGARTSALHAFDIERFARGGYRYVRFKVHPMQRDSHRTVRAEAREKEMRRVKSSTGHVTERPVILTDLEILGDRHEIELTLVPRDEMGFRMLLGRQALRNHFLVDPGRSYFGGRKPRGKKKRKKR